MHIIYSDDTHAHESEPHWRAENEYKEDNQIVIYMDIISAVDMTVAFEDTNDAREAQLRCHFVKQGVQDARNATMTRILPKKVLLRKIQYRLTEMDIY
jgi:hypothetical protein